MNNITKEQWVKIEKEMSGLFVSVCFKYKGYDLHIVREREGENKTTLTVYVDDLIKGAWISALTCSDKSDEHPEGMPTILKEIWKLKTKARHSKKQQASMEKAIGKRRTKKDYPELYAIDEYYWPYFSKASVLCRQFKKLEGLELVKGGDE
ncbi:hypothetical protein [Vibrio echinoideorum]|uniref:hypothetical protein n=1 Tax=Vibrio echinoideorum TaxID=2100116 RepID=UPI0010802D22|nr:hypothetical protein [Vibrio echinoideorum]